LAAPRTPNAGFVCPLPFVRIFYRRSLFVLANGLPQMLGGVSGESDPGLIYESFPARHFLCAHLQSFDCPLWSLPSDFDGFRCGVLFFFFFDCSHFYEGVETSLTLFFAGTDSTFFLFQDLLIAPSPALESFFGDLPVFSTFSPPDLSLALGRGAALSGFPPAAAGLLSSKGFPRRKVPHFPHQT